MTTAQTLDAPSSTPEDSNVIGLPSLNESLGALQSELERFKSALEHIELSKEAARQAVDAAQQAGQAAGRLAERLGMVAGQTETLVGRIDRVDFPSRLDKLDATVSALHVGFQTVQGRLDGVERNVQETVRTAQVTTGEHVAVVGKAVSSAQHQTEGLVTQHATNQEKELRQLQQGLDQQAAIQTKTLRQLQLLLWGTLGGLIALIVLVSLR